MEATHVNSLFPGLRTIVTATSVKFQFGSVFETYQLVGNRFQMIDCSDNGTFPAATEAYIRSFLKDQAHKVSDVA